MALVLHVVYRWRYIYTLTNSIHFGEAENFEFRLLYDYTHALNLTVLIRFVRVHNETRFY